MLLGSSVPDSRELEALLATKLQKYKWPVAYFSLPENFHSQGQIKIARKQVRDWFAKRQSTYQLVMS